MFLGNNQLDSHYTTDWSAEGATNGVVDGGVFMNMLPKDHIYVFRHDHVSTVPSLSQSTLSHGNLAYRGSGTHITAYHHPVAFHLGPLSETRHV